MKLHQILDGIPIVITNEEQQFIDRHPKAVVQIASLDDHDTWTAQNLVRKGVYKLTNDSKNIVINRGHETKRKSL